MEPQCKGPCALRWKRPPNRCADVKPGVGELETFPPTHSRRLYYGEVFDLIYAERLVLWRTTRAQLGLPERGALSSAAKRRLHRALGGEPWKRERRDAERKALLDQIKVSRGCADCGYNAHHAALDFDHLPGAIKLGDVAKMKRNTSSRWEAVLAEIEKCEVVCSNCHRIRGFNRMHSIDST